MWQGIPGNADLAGEGGAELLVQARTPARFTPGTTVRVR
jgi:hypothetical protein